MKKKANQRMEQFGEDIFKPILESEGYTKEFLEEIKFKDRILFSWNLVLGIEGGILLRDLVPILLLNKTKTDFIFSDSPIVLYNLVHHKEESGHTGLQSPGLLIFVPLNNRLLLMMFDDNSYHIKFRPNFSLKIRDEKFGLNLI